MCDESAPASTADHRTVNRPGCMQSSVSSHTDTCKGLGGSRVLIVGVQLSVVVYFVFPIFMY